MRSGFEKGRREVRMVVFLVSTSIIPLITRDSVGFDQGLRGLGPRTDVNVGERENRHSIA